VEDGLLSEIESAFKDLFAEFLTPGGGMPRGSLILIGSLSHLGARGLDSYAGDLCGVISSLSARAGPSVEVVPFVPVPVAGIGGGGRIREILDLDSWIAGSGLGPGVLLDGARRAFWEVVLEAGEGPALPNGDRSLFIPATCRNPRRRTFISPGTASPLPSSVRPITQKEEESIVYALLEDINKLFGLGIDPNPSLERGCVTQGTYTDKKRTVLVGASHMKRLADQMGSETVSLAFSGFRPKEKAIAEIVNKLAELKLTKEDTVVIDLLSNSVFMGTDQCGLPTEAVRAEDGSYHIVGSLAIAPASVTKKILAGCSALAKSLKDTGTVLISPIPRYVYSKCCDNPEHVDNFEDSERDEEIVLGLEGVKKIMHNWAMEHDLTYDLIDPTQLADPSDLGLRTRTTVAGRALWRKDDPIHLTPEAYGDLAVALRDTVLSGPAAESVSVTGSEKEGRKRKVPESIVTRQPVLQHKKGRGAAPQPAAGWLLGRIDRADRGSDRGRGHARGGHGHRPSNQVFGYGRSGSRRGGWARGRRFDGRKW
jgi:hypothetical protein